jgi:serine protein kinase
MTTQITTLLLDVVPEPRGTMATVMANGQQLGWYTALYEQHQQEEITLPEYLERCREHPEMYASPHERLLNAIGEPVVLDTSADERLSRIFSNRKIRTYPSFDAFYGMEDVIDHIVAFLRHAAQGLEEAKQVLYLLGPVGGGKSSLAERLKELMEQEPFYALYGSPINESPLGLFADQYQRKALEDHYGIPSRCVPRVMSPWAAKRLRECHGDVSHFTVVKRYPSMLNQVAIAKTEPGDENNQDISALVGKVDIRKLEEFAQDDPDAYSFSGGLARGNQGILEFVEMFKAPIKTLNPLLTATQEGNYKGTEGIGAIPFNGIILAHSNESEWEEFRNNKRNEAFIDRVNIVKVPYCLRVTEEEQIYRKLLQHSALAEAPCAPQTLRMLAQVSVLTRLKDPGEHSNLFSKMRAYDGEQLKNVDPKAKSIQEYRDDAGVDEGMQGLSTRFAFKVLSKTFNYATTEVAANPVHLMYVLRQEILHLQHRREKEFLTFINEYLAERYKEFIGKEIQTAFVESYSAYGQNIFDRYVQYADFWLRDDDYRDPDTGEMFNRPQLNMELEKIEKPAGIVNAKDFRNEIVNFVLRWRAEHRGESPDWTSYEKLREVIEKKMFSNTEELLPVISFTQKSSSEDQKKHDDFVQRMMQRGYTENQVRLVVDWFQRVQKSS